MSCHLSKYPLWPQQPIEWLLAILFLISPFYLVSSHGGTGFDLPFNITVWLAATWVITLAVWRFATQSVIVLPRNYLALLALPVGILLSAALSGVHDPMDWLFRIIYIFAGVLFLFGLFQFHIKNTDRLFLLLAVATLLHSLLGLAQLFRPEFISASVIPRTATPVAIGVFQQVNVMASFLVTGLLICLYLLMRPITTQRVLLQAFLIVTITLATYVVVATGSRIGLLTALLGLFLLVGCYFSQIKKRPVCWLITLMMMVIASWLAQEGLHKTLDKSYRLVGANYADQRLVIYKVSLDVISDSPLLGHGIGSFMDKWGRASADFHADHPDIEMPSYLGHPHNELLQWSIEGGIVAVLGILIAAMAIFWFAIKLKKRRAFVYLVLLLPITFHTQVEHPFYISSLHWFVWLTILFVLLNHYTMIRNNQLSMTASSILKTASLLILLLGSVFTVHSLFAQKQLDSYTKQLQQVPQMREALSNPYFKRASEQIVMRISLRNAIAQKQQSKILEIADWLEIQRAIKPELHLYGDLLNAYTALNDETQKCSTAFEGLRHYPTNKVLKEIVAKC